MCWKNKCEPGNELMFFRSLILCRFESKPMFAYVFKFPLHVMFTLNKIKQNKDVSQSVTIH